MNILTDLALLILILISLRLRSSVFTPGPLTRVFYILKQDPHKAKVSLCPPPSYDDFTRSLEYVRSKANHFYLDFLRF